MSEGAAKRKLIMEQEGEKKLKKEETLEKAELEEPMIHENLQNLMPPPPSRSTPRKHPAVESFSTPSTSLQGLGLTTPPTSTFPSSSWSSSLKKRYSDISIDVEDGANGLFKELAFEYANMHEPWKWFHDSLEIKSQKWEEDNYQHFCYFFIAEKHLEEIKEQLKLGPLSDDYIDKIIREYIKYIGECSELQRRAGLHITLSKFKDIMIRDKWVMINMLPQSTSNGGKGKEMEHVMLMIAKIIGIFNAQETSGYGLYNSDPGHSTSCYYSKILADLEHEHYQKLLNVFKESVLWGLHFGAKLYLSKRIITSSDALLEYQRLYNQEHRDETLEKNAVIYAENREDILQKHRDHYQKNAAALQKYQKENQERHNANRRNQRAGIPNPRKPLAEKKCGACGAYGHVRTNSSCPAHPKHRFQF